jgi:holo-[acyl-carrier protein] synthase
MKHDTTPDLPSIPCNATILGVGIDIVASARVVRMLEVHDKRFLRRLFTEQEAEYCLTRKDPVPDLAVRLAAKEACFKAIGGRRKMGLGWRCFEVVLDHQGIPFINLRDAAKIKADSMGLKKVWLSLTHEDEWSVAVVVMTT